jgi:CheY-like chemotaxis protein
MASQLRPNVVTMDLDMPVMDGVEATAQVVELGIPVVVTGTESGDRIGEALGVGAAAYVKKSNAFVSPPKQLA